MMMMSSRDMVRDRLDLICLTLSCICCREQQAVHSEGTRVVLEPGCLPCSAGNEKCRRFLRKKERCSGFWRLSAALVINVRWC